MEEKGSVWWAYGRVQCREGDGRPHSVQPYTRYGIKPPARSGLHCCTIRGHAVDSEEKLWIERQATASKSRKR
jgi:hypothetical protein